MPANLLLIGVMLLQILASPFRAAVEQSAIEATNNQVDLVFPTKIVFKVDLSSSAEINEVVLEYGVDQLTCGKLLAKSYPDFQPSKKVSVGWAWEMKQSGSLPPGAKIWWRWIATDAAGNTLVTDLKNVVWIDRVTPWKALSQGSIALHWYQGADAYGRELLDNAVQSLVMLDKNIGLKPDGVIDLYIFPSPQELTDAVYFMPDWTGGLAYPENNIVLIGISPDQMVWGKHAETHELTHVLVDRLAFSCLGDLPTWLNEGIAKYSEGDWDTDARNQLQNAISSDQLISVRALSSSFPEDAEKAGLAYTQSQSVVTFLINEYKQEKLLQLLSLLREGTTIDDALRQVYGYDQDGLEDAWRAKVNAKPRSPVLATATPMLAPTEVPTIVPISDVPLVENLSPTAGATLSQPAAPDEPALTLVPPTPTVSSRSYPNKLLFGILGIACLLAFVLVVVLAVVIVLVLNRKKG